jgi:hypothetical protein
MQGQAALAGNVVFERQGLFLDGRHQQLGGLYNCTEPHRWVCGAQDEPVQD